MAATDCFASVNEVKVDLQHIYDRPDPRAYFRELGKLDYDIPDAAKPIFQRLIAAIQDRRPGRVHVLDLGCSYGINAALLKHDLGMGDLYAHWTAPGLSNVPPKELIVRDRRFFADMDRVSELEVIGLDPASHAVGFAEATGLIDEGIVADLETEKLAKAAATDLAPVDLVISTGCVGYVTDESFKRLLPAVTRGAKPWIANFVLRAFPFDAIADALAEWGYVTEKLEGRTFTQRRFASREEEEAILDQLVALGIDPWGKEVAGHLHAEFFLSRPADHVRDQPLAALFAA